MEDFFDVVILPALGRRYTVLDTAFVKFRDHLKAWSDVTVSYLDSRPDWLCRPR
jgi:hypothetical protein